MTSMTSTRHTLFNEEKTTEVLRETEVESSQTKITQNHTLRRKYDEP